MAGGYGAGSASSDKKFLFNTVWVPGSLTEAESFLWYQAHPRVAVGVAYLHKQGAFRWLASVNLVPERATTPGVNASVGVQGIGTGNPGYSLTLEKNFAVGPSQLNVFAGIGFRSNEDHSHPLAGFKWSPDGKLTLGLQWDGHNTHPFTTYSHDNFVYGLYLANGKSVGYMIGARF